MAKISQAECRRCNGLPKRKNAAITCRHGICHNQHCQSGDQQDKGWSQWKTEWNKWIWTHKMTFLFELWNIQFRFTGYFPRIPSVSRDRGKSLALWTWSVHSRLHTYSHTDTVKLQSLRMNLNFEFWIATLAALHCGVSDWRGEKRLADRPADSWTLPQFSILWL